jgi:hypothetical protein
MGCCLTTNKVHQFEDLNDQKTTVKEITKPASFHWGYEGDSGKTCLFIFVIKINETVFAVATLFLYL